MPAENHNTICQAAESEWLLENHSLALMASHDGAATTTMTFICI